MTLEQARANPAVWDALRKQVEHDLAERLPPRGVKPPPPCPTPKGSSSRLSRHGTAIRTPCDCGRTHASKGEARVCAALRADPEVYRLLQQVRFPLLNLGGSDTGGALYLSVDFVVWRQDGTWDAVDAKHPVAPRSRDWRRGAAAFAGHYGRTVREVWVDGKGTWKEAR